MALGYAQVSIAGIDLKQGDTWCKCYVLDGANLQNTTTGSVTYAADGTPYVQTLTPVGGIAFGIEAEFLPPDVLSSIIAAVMAAVASGDSFTVTAEDDVHDFSVEAHPDFSQKWDDYPKQRTNEQVVKGPIFRFITAE